MHLSYSDISKEGLYHPSGIAFRSNLDIDDAIFYSVPTSFFVLDDRIPAIIRDLITEAEGCIKMNFLTGASACMRKAIYELLVIAKAEGTDYEQDQIAEEEIPQLRSTALRYLGSHPRYDQRQDSRAILGSLELTIFEANH